MIRLPDNIGIFDDVVSREWCDDLISAFDKKVEAVDYKGGDLDKDGIWFKDNDKRKDISMCIDRYESLNEKSDELRGILIESLNDYMSVIVDQNRDWAEQIGRLELKMQRTPPGGGFCGLHFEQGNDPVCARRFAVYSLYLNDLPEHCGTDFPNQNAVVTPKAGRLAIWPAAYTHPHRCSLEVDQTKYIVTGWYNYHTGEHTPEISS